MIEGICPDSKLTETEDALFLLGLSPTIRHQEPISPPTLLNLHV